MREPSIKRQSRRSGGSGALTQNLASQLNQWDYATNIKIFHTEKSRPMPVSQLNLAPLPPTSEIQGFLCQAAREVAGVTQAWLWRASGVSRKTINDFENGFISPKSALIAKLRYSLESAGVAFVAGSNFVGVVCYLRRLDVEQRE